MLLNSLAHTTLDESGQDDHCGLVTSSCGINKVVRKPLPDDHLRRPDLPWAPFYGSEPRPKRADRLRPWWRTKERTSEAQVDERPGGRGVAQPGVRNGSCVG